MNKTTFRLYLLVACGAVAFFCLLQNLGTVLGWAAVLLSILRPFLVGGILAFILNILLARVRPLFSRDWFQSHPGAANACAILAVYLLVAALLAGIGLFVVPPFVESIRTLAANFEGYYQNVLDWANRLSARVDPELWLKLGIDQKLNDLLKNLPDLLEKVATGLVGGVVGAVSGLVGGVVDTFMGLLVSVYILADKARMKAQGTRIIRAMLPQKTAESLLRVLKMTSRTFSAFFSGQLTEAFILGALCFIGMSIIGFPYAPMVSVIIGITNLIPIVGPIVGTVPCALLVLLAEGNLLRTVAFVAFIIILQQLESNLIYPRVVGTQVGLPAFWVLAAVVVGGGLFGVVGMIVGIPALAVARKLLHEEVDRREARAESQQP